MPTAAKIVAAIFFMAFGYFAADLVKPLLPEGTPTPWLNEGVAAVGLLSGWRMSGRNAGSGYRASVGFGLTTVALIAFWAVFIFAAVKMLQLSLDNRYRGPVQALQSMFGIAVGYFRLIATQEILLTMLFGGVIGGWLSEWISKRWS